MNRPSVEAVLINWKRPDNAARIVEALRGQSVPCTVTLCDCHPGPEYALSSDTLSRVDRVYRWGHNLGAYSRYVPCAAYDHEFTYFADDDLLPGSRCLEHFLDYASGRKFGVLGQTGRRFKPDMVYRPRGVPRTARFEEVDLVIQAYFVRTRHLGHIANVRWKLDQQHAIQSEDDILLAVAMQIGVGLGSYLTPLSDDPETSTSRLSLPSPFALSGRLDHLERRTELFAKARSLGWRPLGERRSTSLGWAIRGQLLAGEKRLRVQRRLRAGKEL